MPDLVFLNLDEITTRLAREQGIIGAKQGASELAKEPKRFLDMGLDALAHALRENPGRPLLVDVGAGFLLSERAEWVLRYTSVLLKAREDVAYQRMREKMPNDKRTLEQYKSQEFSPLRRKLYKGATYTIEADCDRGELAAKLVNVLTRQVLPRPM